ncbi:hypothetical protein DRW41_22000 [Neobacillus piezotolerans]|uniref:Uncharacterized protein n=1 Tax=Neobacillus piezotolerans TaxID=2259171 RepID=A0A3D8GJR8_9BACI|nr:HGGxSTG domain-containing protein [Neobacillus piezotolerans]RDU34700.1 hypothetical protein DRW41_22000 [Neobacillus piezotolerans]
MDDYLCGAKTRSGRPCRNPRFVGTGRCKYHGGLSTGPKDPSKLKGNKNAVGNKGGGAPKGNKNAAKKKPEIREVIIPLGRRKIYIKYAILNGEQREISRQVV